MRSRLALSLVAIAALLALLAGCGGGGDDTTSASEGDCEPVDGQCNVVAEAIVAMATEHTQAFDYPGRTAPEIVVE